MPYRRLVYSDIGRAEALKTAQLAFDNLPEGEVVISVSTSDRLETLYPLFVSKLTLRDVALAEQGVSTADVEEKRQDAMTSASQFFQSFNLGVARDYFPAAHRAYYGLDMNSSAVPDMKSDVKFQFWADKIITGDPLRVAAGGAAMAMPSLAEFTAKYNPYLVSKNAQKLKKEAYDRAQETVALMRAEVDLLILNIWDEVEAYFNTGDINSKRRHAREWGVVYANMPDAFSMEGQVTDLAGIPLLAATVKLVEPDVSDETNSLGKYRITEVDPGTYTVEVTKSGYQTQIEPGIVITAGEVKLLNIQMIPLTGNITVNVFAEGQPLEDATVGIEDLGLTAQTNAGGQAFLNNVSPGTWYVDASKDGYIPQNQQISIVAGETIILSFELDLA